MAFGASPSWFKKGKPESVSGSSAIEHERDDAAADFKPEDKIGRGSALYGEPSKGEAAPTRKPSDYTVSEWVSAIGPTLGQTFEDENIHHEAVSAGIEETPLETRSRLESLVKKLGIQKPSAPTGELELTSDQAFTDIAIASTEAYERREARAQKFAEKFGIADVRNELLSAEREYTDAIRDLKAKTVKLPFSRVPDEVREKYDAASLAWRKALLTAVDLAPKKEKQQATIISFRDTVMRAEEARQRGVLEAATMKDQKLLGKVLNWGQVGLSRAVTGYLEGTKKVGQLAARGHTKGREYLGADGISEAHLIERYTRATRIVSGALLGTLVMGSVGTAGVATTVLFKSVRGTLGLALGGVTGVYTGKGYRKTVGTILREGARDAKRDQRIDENDLDHERRAWRFGRGSALEKQARMAEVFGAFLGGASASLLSNVTLQEMSSVSSVQEAHETLTHTSQPTEAPAPHQVHTPAVSDVPPQPVVPAHEIPHADTTPLVVGRGEGADKLISDLQDRLRAQYPDSTKAPENVQALLRFDPHTTAKQLGLNYDAGGVMLHPGDSLTVDDHGRLVFHDNVHDRNRILINEKHELHPLQGHVVKAHTPDTHTREPRPRVRLHRDHFNAAADRDAVAQANKDELAREQRGEFRIPTSTEPVVQSHTIDQASLPEAGVRSARLGDLSAPETLPATPAPDSPSAASPSETPPPLIPKGAVEGNVDTSGNTTSSARLGDLAREYTPVSTESVNPFGLRIDAKVPHVYLTETQGVTVYGGSPEAGRLIAEEYAKAHPGVEVMFQVKGIDGLGNQVTYAGEVSTDASGKVFLDIPDPRTEEVHALPDPNTFIDVKP